MTIDTRLLADRLDESWSGWTDLSHSIDESTPPFPGDPRVEIEVLETAGNPSAGEIRVNTSRVSICVHCGTHLDAPFHFIEDGETVDRLPLARCFGRAAFVRLSSTGPGSTISTSDLEPYEGLIRQTGKLVLDTNWARHWKKDLYFEDHPVIGVETAQFLLGCGLHLLAVDLPSVDRHPYPTHYALLGSSAVIVENLCHLDGLDPGLIEFIALPLALAGRDGSPVRAAARNLR